MLEKKNLASYEWPDKLQSPSLTSGTGLWRIFQRQRLFAKRLAIPPKFHHGEVLDQIRARYTLDKSDQVADLPFNQHATP